MMSPASAISMPIVKVMPCTAVTRGLVSRRRRPYGSTGSTAAGRRRASCVGTPKNSGISSPAVVCVAGEDEHADEQVGVVVEAGAGAPRARRRSWG